MHIRPETIADTAAIAEINILAFDKRIAEAAIVALLRQRPSYTPELSLVAEEHGEILGNVIFTPVQIRYAGAYRRVVVLAPLAVHPKAQKMGIGSALVQEGHKIAQAAGYEAAFLLGHSSYYPRFGYQTRAYGASSLLVKTSELPQYHLTSRSPLPEDIPSLMALWEQEEAEIDFALAPDAALVDWLSPNPCMKALVYLQEGEIVGYARGKADDVRLFLAKNHKAAQMIAKDIAGNAEEITLPLHPFSRSADAFAGVPQFQAWDAAMLCPFTWDYPASEIIGRVLWFSAFDIA